MLLFRFCGILCKSCGYHHLHHHAAFAYSRVHALNNPYCNTEYCIAGIQCSVLNLRIHLCFVVLSFSIFCRQSTRWGEATLMFHMYTEAIRSYGPRLALSTITFYTPKSIATGIQLTYELFKGNNISDHFSFVTSFLTVI